MELKGKTVLITGASSGIGKSFAYLFASKGSNVVLVARSVAKLNDIAEDIRERHKVTALAYPKDLSQQGASEELYEQLKSDGVDTDILINNAGFGKWGRFEDFSLADYSSMVQLNIHALMELSYFFIEDFKQKGEAGIINVGSTASLLPVPYSSVYAATKAFALSFTEGLVGEYRSTNISITCLCPSGTESNFNAVANFNKHPDNSTAELMSSDKVASLGLEAFLKGKHYVVTGRKTSIFLARILSRKRILTMVGDYWKKRLGL